MIDILKCVKEIEKIQKDNGRTKKADNRRSQ